jgi:hypothetical protein
LAEIFARERSRFLRFVQQVAELQKGLPAPHAVVKIAVEAVFDQPAGKEPGRQIA